MKIPLLRGKTLLNSATMDVWECISHILFFPSFSSFLSPTPAECRGYADVAQLAEHHARRYAQVQVLPSAPDVCYRIAAPWKGKTATRGLPVRCMKAAGRRIYYLAGPGLCKRNGCDRHTGAGLKSSVVSAYRTMQSELRGVFIERYAEVVR